MKRLILLALISVLSFATASTVSAQKLIMKNGDERFGKTLTTTDSALHYIDSAFINDDEAGILEAKVIGFDLLTSKAITGVIKVRYASVDGTITLGSTVNDMTVTVDSGLSPAAISFATSGNKIYIAVKGNVDTNMKWYSTAKRNSVYKVP